jgi:hypothetical protein
MKKCAQRSIDMTNNSADGPLSFELSNCEGSIPDFGGCDVNEVGDGDANHHQKYLEMFCRALKEHNQDAQRWIEHQFRAKLVDWIRTHPSRDQACQLHSEEYFVIEAFKRSWQASIEHQEYDFKSIGDFLHYLGVCLNAAMLDALRGCSRSGMAQLEVSASFSNDDHGNGEVWRLIEEKLSDARKRHLAFLLFHCALRPVEIVRRCPREFNDVQEVSRMRRDLIELLSQ